MIWPFSVAVPGNNDLYSSVSGALEFSSLKKATSSRTASRTGRPRGAAEVVGLNRDVDAVPQLEAVKRFATDHLFQRFKLEEGSNIV